jgi:ABC-type Fe3+-hydroxamate transport system substrate-binding protein
VSIWHDALGTPHPRAAEDCRIVSLVPSLTELLFALGLGARVVGRTGFCIHPREAVREVPKLGGTKDVDVERLRTLRPTHVIVNIDENEAPLVDLLRAFVPHIIVTHPNAPEDNLALYELFGGVFDAQEAADRLAVRLHAELAACRSRTWPSERVLYLIWKDPWMTVAADTYIARTLECVGWETTHGPGGERGAARYPHIEDLEQAVAAADRVLLSSEPYMFRAPHVAELQARFLRRPVSLIDGEMTSWYGVRAIEGLRYLRSLRSAAA